MNQCLTLMTGRSISRSDQSLGVIHLWGAQFIGALLQGPFQGRVQIIRSEQG